MNTIFRLGVVFLVAGLLGCEDKAPVQVPPPRSAPVQEPAPAVKPELAVVGSEIAGLAGDEVAALIKSGDASKVGSYLVYQMLVRAPEARDAADTIPLIRVDNGRDGARELGHGVYIGAGRMRGALLSMAATGYGAPDGCDAACRDSQISKVLLPFSKKPLFAGAGIGKLDRDAVKAILAAVQIESEDSALGLGADVLYRVFRPTFREYLLIYRAVLAMKDDAMSQYRVALKENAGDARAMLEFYQLFPNLNEIPQQIGAQPSRRIAGISGFWLRRIDDQTAELFASALTDIVRAHDKPLYDTLSKKP